MVRIFAKIHSNAEVTILACCDRELTGKELKRGKVKVKISEGFYKGEAIEEKELAQLLEEFENINLVGKKAVSVALKKGIADEKSIIKLGKVPHVQIFKI